MSFGFPRILKDIHQEIRSALHRGKIVFAAASNDGANSARAFLASQDGVICIHSTDGYGNKSRFNPTAETSPTENFSVVGEAIEAAWPGLGTHDSSGTRRLSGTSFAVPVAVAIAAFMISLVEQRKPEHEQWATAPGSPAGVRAIFSRMSEKRDFPYDYVNPLKWLEKDENSVEELLLGIQARLEGG